MDQCPLYTIIPVCMTAGEIIKTAHQTRRMVITKSNGNGLMLAPRLLQGYKRVKLFMHTERA